MNGALQYSLRIVGDASGLRPATAEAVTELRKVGVAADDAAAKVDGATRPREPGKTPSPAVAPGNPAPRPGSSPSPSSASSTSPSPAPGLPLAPRPGSSPIPGLPVAPRSTQTGGGLPPAAEIDQLTRKIGLQQHEWTNLGRQANDALTMLASGSSVFQVVATQGGQVYDVLKTSKGGVGGALKEIAGLATPARLAVAGFAGALVAAGTAALAYAEGQDAISRSLMGVGRLSGATVTSINAIAEGSAGAARVSVASAREMAATFASTGKINVGLFEELTVVAARYAKTTGTDVPDAAGKLAMALSDPVKGALALNETFGFLSGSMLQVIERQVALGDRTGAQKTILDGLKPSLASVTEQTNAWAAAYDAVTRAAKDAYDRSGRTVMSVVAPTQDQQIEVLRARLDGARARAATGNGNAGFPIDRGYREAMEAQGYTEDMIRREAFPQAPGAAPIAAVLSDAKAAVREIEEQLSEALETKMWRSIGETLDRQIKDVADKTLRAANIVRQLSPTDAEILQLTRWKTELEEAIRTGQATAGTAETLKRVTDELAAGGAAAGAALRGADFARAQVGATAYERGLRAINFQYDELAKKISGANAAAELALNEKLRALALGTYAGQAQADLLRTSIEGATMAGLSGPEQRSARNRQALGVRNPLDDASKAARENTKLGMDVATEEFIRVGRAPSTTYLRDRMTERGVLTPDQAATSAGQAQERERANTQTRQLIDAEQALAISTKATADAIGQSAGKTAELNTEAQLRIRYLANGEKIEGEVAERIRSYAKAVGEATDKVARLRAEEDIRFDRAQLGRTGGDQQIASYLRSRGLGDIEDPVNQVTVAELRLNQALADTRSLASDAFKGFASDMLHGKSAAEAFSGVLDKISTKLLDMAAENLISAALGGKNGGGFKLLSSLFSAFGTGGSTGLPEIGPLPPVRPAGLAGGGHVRGQGTSTSDSIPAWLSDGEYVVRASAVDRVGIRMLDAINAHSWPRFAEGGLVGGATLPTSLSGAAGSSGGVAVHLGSTTIDARGSSMSEAQFGAILDERDRRLVAGVKAALPSLIRTARQRSSL